MRYLLEDTCVRLAKNMSFGRGDGFPAIVLTDRRGDTCPGRAGTARKNDQLDGLSRNAIVAEDVLIASPACST